MSSSPLRSEERIDDDEVDQGLLLQILIPFRSHFIALVHDEMETINFAIAFYPLRC